MPASHQQSSLLQPPTRPIPTLPSNYRRLLDVYLAYTHSCFPILNHGDLNKTSARLDAACVEMEVGPDPDWDVNGGAQTELWAALTVASFQEAEVQDKITPPDLGHRFVKLAPREIYGITRSLIPSSEDASFEVGHVCALLLLSIVKIGEGSNEAAYLLIGTATRLGVL